MALLARRIGRAKRKSYKRTLNLILDYIQARLNAVRFLAEKIQQEEMEANILLMKNRKIQEARVILFCCYGSEEDEREIKKMNEKDADKKEEKKDESVHEEVQEEEGAKKRKLGTRRKLKAIRESLALVPHKRRRYSKDSLHIAPDRRTKKLYGLWESDQVVILHMEEFEDSNDDDTVTSTHEDEERWMVNQLTKFYVQRVEMVLNPPWNLPLLGAKGLTSPEQTATGVNTPGSDENRLKLYVLMYNIVKVADTKS
ncbi:hypothetical protein Tco_0567541 [Tanacetum coccineum]